MDRDIASIEQFEAHDASPLFEAWNHLVTTRRTFYTSARKYCQMPTNGAFVGLLESADKYDDGIIDIVSSLVDISDTIEECATSTSELLRKESVWRGAYFSTLNQQFERPYNQFKEELPQQIAGLLTDDQSLGTSIIVGLHREGLFSDVEDFHRIVESSGRAFLLATAKAAGKTALRVAGFGAGTIVGIKFLEKFNSGS